MRDTTKADLEAANREIKDVVGQNIQLKKEAAEAYQNGYRDALNTSASLASIAENQANMIRYLLGMLIGGMKPGAHQ